MSGVARTRFVLSFSRFLTHPESVKSKVSCLYLVCVLPVQLWYCLCLFGVVSLWIKPSCSVHSAHSILVFATVTKSSLTSNSLKSRKLPSKRYSTKTKDAFFVLNARVASGRSEAYVSPDVLKGEGAWDVSGAVLFFAALGRVFTF